jgi:branched-chain amino acid transport system substrate-binding protein
VLRVDSQIVGLRSVGADILYDVTIQLFLNSRLKRSRKWPKSIWKPVHLLNGVSASVGGVMRPTGLDNSKGVLSTADRPTMEERFGL